MGRKKVSEMTPEELEAFRSYMRAAKAKQRAKMAKAGTKETRYKDRTSTERSRRHYEKQKTKKQ